MSDELNVCAAAFFRSIGKDVVTPKEFTMYVTLDVKWMSSKEASALMQVLIEEKAMVSSNGYLKPGKDFSSLQVPIAYRPTDAVRNAVAAKMKKGKTQTPAGKASGADVKELTEKVYANSVKKG